MPKQYAPGYSQKGTIGAMINQTDLPYTIDGTVPDILFNSHGIPSHPGDRSPTHVVEDLRNKGDDEQWESILAGIHSCAQKHPGCMILVMLYEDGMCHVKWFDDSETFNEACLSVRVGEEKRDAFWDQYRTWSQTAVLGTRRKAAGVNWVFRCHKPHLHFVRPVHLVRNDHGSIMESAMCL
jgi:hypothetical protein